jgi:SpoVK/Ycf46/Vps4 family AAA+-type ATPase
MTPPADRSVVNALRLALQQDPQNGVLWQHLAEQLQRLGEATEAITALQKAAELLPEEHQVLLLLVRMLREAGRTGEALVRAEDRLRVRDDPSLRLELARVLIARGNAAEAARHYRQAVRDDGSLHDPQLAQRLDSELEQSDDEDAATESPMHKVTHVDPPTDDATWAAQFDWGDLRVTFSDVAGLEAVKRQIHLRILAPFKNPEIYQAFGRTGGGGILLYGPPGCGKTFIARATAGECGARFPRALHFRRPRYGAVWTISAPFRSGRHWGRRLRTAVWQPSCPRLSSGHVRWLGADDHL